MILTETRVLKLLIVILTLCCILNSAVAGKLIGSLQKASEKEGKVEMVAQETENSDNKTIDGNVTVKRNSIEMVAGTSQGLSFILRGLWNWIREDMSESLFHYDDKTSLNAEGRTFGKIRRMQMALIPIVFKFGVLSAMIAFLVAVGIKTLFLVKVLIVMNLLALLAKFFTLKTNLGHVEHYAGPSSPIWSPYLSSGWQSIPAEHHSNKEIHLHIHGGHMQPHSSGYSYGGAATGPSHGWERRQDDYPTVLLRGHKRERMANELATAVNSVDGSEQNVVGRFPENR